MIMLTLFRNLFSPPRDLILVVVAFWIGSMLSDKRAHQHGLTPNALEKITFYPVIGFVLGGRFMYVVENIAVFLQKPRDIISLNIELFDVWGGIVVALLTAFLYGQREGLPFWPTLDALTPLFATITVGFGLAHLASGSAFGRETNLSWGIELWGAVRHPSQVYEILASLLTLGLLWLKKPDPRPGIHFLTFVALTSGWRVFLEAYRGDSTLIFGGVRQAQAVALLILAVSLFMLEKIRNRPTTESTP